MKFACIYSNILYQWGCMKKLEELDFITRAKICFFEVEFCHRKLKWFYKKVLDSIKFKEDFIAFRNIILHTFSLLNGINVSNP